MMWSLYNCLFPIVYLLLLPRFLIRMCRRGGYRRGFLQRLGLYDAALWNRLQSQRRIWVHAVSVGEIYVALRFMDAIRARQLGTAFVLTTTTSTGHAIAEKQIGHDDVLLYFPVDFPQVIRRVLDLLNPLALVLVEGEMWPNLVRQSKRRGLPVMLLNGRLSDRSYCRYQKIRFLVKRLLAFIDLFCVQGEEERRRLIDLGADPDKVKVMGSAKYDVAEGTAHGTAPVGEILHRAGFNANVRLLVGGSTWPGEEAALLGLHKKLRISDPNARLVLVPRHMERSNDVVADIETSGLSFVRWSEAKRNSAVSDHAKASDCSRGQPPLSRKARDESPPDVLLVDTTGELKQFYAAATIIFIGKSLTAHGGQNVIEAAVFAKPIIVGPHMENFRSVMADFLAANALIQVRDKDELEQAVMDIWGHEEKRRRYGERACQVVCQKAGAIRASVELFLTLAANPLKSSRFFTDHQNALTK